jgi:hypothetical protein
VSSTYNNADKHRPTTATVPFMVVNKVPLKTIPAALHFPDNNMQTEHCQCEHRAYNIKEKAVSNM